MKKATLTTKLKLYMRSLLAVIIITMMIFGSVSTTAWAEDTTTGTEEDLITEVTVDESEDAQTTEDTTSEAEASEETTPTEAQETTEAKEEEEETAQEEESAEAEEEEPANTLTELDGKAGMIKVHATFDAGTLPEGTQMKVEELTKEKDYEDYARLLADKAEDRNETVVSSKFVDIAFVDEKDNEIEPEGDVKVTMSFTDAVFGDSDSDWTLWHFDDSKKQITIEELDASIKTTKANDVQKVVFTNDGFSVYTLAQMQDENFANGASVTVSAADELIAAMESDSEQTVILANDIELPAGTGWKTLQAAKVLDLNGNTLTLASGSTSYFVVSKENSLYVKNGTVNCNGSTREAFEVHGNLYMEKVDITGATAYRALNLAESTAELTMTNCNAYDNTENVIDGSAANVTVESCQFTNNGSLDDNAHAIHAANITNLTVTKSEFTGNRASDSGAAIYTRGETNLTVDQCNFFENTAMGDGGAIYYSGHQLGTDTYMTLSITNTTFSLNEASDGGALALQNANATIGSDVTFTRNKANGNGGAIFASGKNQGMSEGWTITLDGTSITNNESGHNGGGVCIEESGSLTIEEGTKITDNTASHDGGGVYMSKSGSFDTTLTIKGGTIDDNDSDGTGGGVHVDATTVTMTAGSVSNNSYKTSDADWDSNSNWELGGGGFYVGGSANMTISGGNIDNNFSFNGGGGVFFASTGQLTMTGGSVSGNDAWGGEGGGISIHAIGAKGVITGGHIENNSTGFDGDTANTDYPHWGGGGLFARDGAYMYVTNMIITDNDAYGYGGGVAGCATGRVFIVGEEGAAIYGNEDYDTLEDIGETGANLSGASSAKNADHTYAASNETFVKNGSDDYFCALNSVVENEMLGGGQEDWTGSADGIVVKNLMEDETITAANVMGLNANPSESAIETAKAKAAASGTGGVYVTGNKSYTHGGGILCNGYLLIGNTDEIATGSRVELDASKALTDQRGDELDLENEEFTFELYTVDDEGEETILSTGTNDEDGKITFNVIPSFMKEGTFTYYMREVIPEEEADTEDVNVVYDKTIWKMTFVVTKVEQDSISYENTTGGTTTIKVYRYMVSDLEDSSVQTSTDGGKTWTNANHSYTRNDEAHADTLDLGASDATFTNHKYPNRVKVTATKKWTDQYGYENTTDAEEITVKLTRRIEGGKEETVDTQKLNEKNSWTYTWTQLAEVDDDGNAYTYTVTEETTLSKFTTTTSSTTSDDSLQEYYVPATTITQHHKYIVTYGDKLLTINDDSDHMVTSADVSDVEEQTEEITVGTTKYTSWYDVDDIPATATFTATSKNGGLAFVNAGTENANSLLIQSVDGQNLKASRNSGDYASLMRTDSTSVLQGTYEWSISNTLYTIIWDEENERFDAVKTSEVTEDTKVAKVYQYLGYYPETKDFDTVITNKHNDVLIDITGTKVWDDNDDQDGKRPDSITVGLYADGTLSRTATVKADANGKWSFSFTGLQKYKNNTTDKKKEEIVYTVKELDDDENAVEDNGTITFNEAEYKATYTTNKDGSTTITNTYTPETTDVTATKVWDDKDNQDGMRADVTLTLTGTIFVTDANKVTTTKTVVTKTATIKKDATGDDLTVTWKDLAVYNSGAKITYAVTEAKIRGYTTKVDKASDGYTFTVTNTHTPETTSVKGTKTWSDGNDADGLRPENITVRLYANGVAQDSVKVTADDNWAYSFTNLDKYANGKEITYTVKEDTVSGYKATYSDSGITNTHTPETTDITVTKAWDDANDQDGLRTSVKVQLYENGTAKGSAVTLTKKNNWTYTWTGLNVNENGAEITYTLEELTEADGYTSDIDGDQYEGFTITNTHTPETTDISVEKVWDDFNDKYELRTKSVKVQLYANGTKYGAAVALSDDNDWYYTWEDLAVNKSGKAITYTVKEVSVPKAYIATVSGSADNGFTIKNKIDPTSGYVAGEDDESGEGTVEDTDDGDQDTAGEDDDAKGDIAGENVDTGDDTMITFWAGMMLAGVVALASLTFKCKRDF